MYCGELLRHFRKIPRAHHSYTAVYIAISYRIPGILFKRCSRGIRKRLGEIHSSSIGRPSHTSTARKPAQNYKKKETVYEPKRSPSIGDGKKSTNLPPSRAAAIQDKDFSLTEFFLILTRGLVLLQLYVVENER